MQSTVQSVLNMTVLRSTRSKGLEVPCQNIVRTLKNDAVLRKRFSELRLRCDLFRKPEGLFYKLEGFF